MATATPRCPTCRAEGELVRLRNAGLKLIPNEVGFICSKDPNHWETYEVKPFKKPKEK
ncbi:unnamed protein product [marine sediment metagenome]|uniref:Uncharacterized protein n=1 Tax=marine sediment metagenome TaxID=412755 RepID=X1L9A2_9ZZZZ